MGGLGGGIFGSQGNQGFGGAQGPDASIMGNTPMSTGRLNFPGMGGNMGLDMHRIPIIGNMFQNPYDVFKQQQMQNAAGAYSMYRPEQMQAYMNAMNQQSASLQPMNNALASMYGSGATQGFNATNPYGPSAFSRGASAGTNPQMPDRPTGPPQWGVSAPVQGSAAPYGLGHWTTPGQASSNGNWRLGRTSDATEANRSMANASGGNYGAAGPGLAPGAGTPGWTPPKR